MNLTGEPQNTAYRPKVTRNLVLCIDGTWNSSVEGSRFFSYPTNVARVSKLLINDGERQRVVYLPGVGTQNFSDRMIGGLWGLGTTARVLKAYQCLCENYEAGDQIALFGFSRGAFAVRALAGLIGALGLVRCDQLGYIEKVMKLHQRPINWSWMNEVEKFKSQHAAYADILIRFIGVWDTVIRHGPLLSAIGRLVEHLLSRRFGLPDRQPGRHLRYVAHALALDETRFAFRPWRFDIPTDRGSDIEELWFAGSHSDVGGGYADARPAEFPLGWIVERAAHAGLLFHEIPAVSSDSHKAPLNDSRIGEWRFLPSQRRVVRELDRIHDSVELRVRCTKYQPKARLPRVLSFSSA